MKRESPLATRLKNQAGLWGVGLTDEQTGQLLRYAQILSSYRLANVIGTTDLQRIVLNHVLDSLSCLLSEPLRRVISLVDVGAGGGLPGISLKLVRPQMHLTLLDAHSKKINFLRYVTRELNLDGVDILHERAETAGRNPAWRGAFEAATARAVAPLSVLAEYCAPLVCRGGVVVAMKGPIGEVELAEGERAARALGAVVSGLIEVPLLPGMEAKERRLVIIEKVAETPPEYPRREGRPKKRPLGQV